VFPTQVFPGQCLAGGLPAYRTPGRDRCAYQLTTTPDDLSRLAQAYQWASRIMVLSLEMVLPGLVGFWIDRKLGTVCAFLLVGLIGGCTLGMRRVIRLVAKDTKQDDTKSKT
jgi:F0F1-type ATP synthase assembly protein I